jgi:hypothetical protein
VAVAVGRSQDINNGGGRCYRWVHRSQWWQRLVAVVTQWWWISEVSTNVSVPIGERFGVDGHHLAEAFSCFL